MDEMKKNLSIYRLNLAKETLANAKLSFDNHFYRDCINRSYYAAFYAIKAILALEGIDFKRHKDAVGYFNKNYVATGEIPGEIGKRLGRLKTIREESDYSDFFVASQDDSQSQYESAVLIYEAVKN